MNNTIKYLTVTALNRYVSYKFEIDEHLTKLYVKGEISNLRPSKGNLFFSLKDENSEISAVMYQYNASLLKFAPIDGMTVLVEASLEVYQKKGTYNLIVNKMTDVGLGESYLNFIRLKEKLQKEGLFDEKHKLPIPNYPQNVGIVTSANGDGLYDIVSTISKRMPIINLYLYPSLVQGFDAPKDLIRALNLAYKNDSLDCIIIGRGGGSVEDLSCFNDEKLARTIYSSKIPIISAVGHESDYTISDFVASFRAPTPTAAAVRISKDKYDILREIDNIERHLKSAINKVIDCKMNKYVMVNNSSGLNNYLDNLDRQIKNIENIEYTLRMISPLGLINQKEQFINDLSLRLKLLSLDNKIEIFEKMIINYEENLNKLISKKINDNNVVINGLIERMIIINPLNLMKKGYSLVYQSNKLITSIKKIDRTKEVVLKMVDGEVITNIKEILRRD